MPLNRVVWAEIASRLKVPLFADELPTAQFHVPLLTCAITPWLVTVPLKVHVDVAPVPGCGNVTTIFRHCPDSVTLSWSNARMRPLGVPWHEVPEAVRPPR